MNHFNVAVEKVVAQPTIKLCKKYYYETSDRNRDIMDNLLIPIQYVLNHKKNE
jgi:hypothetical protein